MIVRLFSIVIIFLILGVLISQLKVIPSWENVQTVLIVSVFIGALVTGLLYLFKLWVKKNNEKKTSLTQQVGSTIIVIIVFPLALLFGMSDFYKPEFVDEFKLANKTIYVYHEYCFPPDSACECDTYGSYIYTKNHYLPIMNLVVKTDFYVGNIQIYDNELTAKASSECTKDQDKILKINL